MVEPVDWNEINQPFPGVDPPTCSELPSCRAPEHSPSCEVGIVQAQEDAEATQPLRPIPDHLLKGVQSDSIRLAGWVLEAQAEGRVHLAGMMAELFQQFEKIDGDRAAQRRAAVVAVAAVANVRTHAEVRAERYEGSRAPQECMHLVHGGREGSMLRCRQPIRWSGMVQPGGKWVHVHSALDSNHQAVRYGI